MKKSKIIIGAIALLGVSVAATTTTTLAWFSSSQKASVAIKDVIAIDSSANLKVTITGNKAHGTGGTVTGGDGTSSTASFSIDPLRDVSLDLAGAEGALATYATTDTDGKVTGYKQAPDISTGTDEAKKGSFATTTGTGDNVKNVYYYAEFDITLKLDSVLNQKYNVYFDPKASAVSGGVTTKKIDSSIRVGFRNSTVLTKGTNYTTSEDSGKAALANTIVWAENYDVTSTVSEATNPALTTGLKYNAYTNSSTTSTATYYKDNVATDTKPTATTSIGYLGDMNSQVSGATELVYHTYIWFEGEDILCNSDEISATAYALALSFYAELAA